MYHLSHGDRQTTQGTYAALQNYGVVFMGTVRKETGQLEDIFLQTVPVKYNRGCNRSFAVDMAIHSNNEDKTVSDGGKKGEFVPPISRARSPVTGVVYVMTNQIAF